MYRKLREKSGKYTVKKFAQPAGTLSPEHQDLLARITAESDAMEELDNEAMLNSLDFSDDALNAVLAKGDAIEAKATAARMDKLSGIAGGVGQALGFLNAKPQQNQDIGSSASGLATNVAQYAAQNGGSLKGMMSSGAVTGAIGSVANAALDKIEGAVMGDKTFDAQSEAIDDTVRMASQELSKRWAPWGLLAAGVIETLNFADKAAGKSVQGFETGDAGSGFQGIDTTQDTMSYRGSQTGKMKRDLMRRNQQMNMALAASNINESEQFQMTSRMNSINNVMEANRIALAGGIDTSLLGG